MSNFFPRIVKCALCGKEGAQQSLVSSSKEAEELDGRPIGMLRDTMQCWVQMCSNPACGYCTFDIGKELPGARECIETDDYRDHLNGNMRDLVKRFYCAALVSLSAVDPKGAFECFRNAAWACDDSGMGSEAKAFRMLAAQLFPAGHEPVWLADLLRRSGNHQQALSACNSFLRQTGLGDWSKKLLEFEKKLTLALDSGPHSTEEVKP